MAPCPGAELARAVTCLAAPVHAGGLCSGTVRESLRMERNSVCSKCLLSPFFSRTIYYTGYRQVYAMEAQTVFRCCPGWSQQPGEQGCLSRKCPFPDTKSLPQKRPRVKGLSLAVVGCRPHSCIWWHWSQREELLGPCVPHSAPWSC